MNHMEELQQVNSRKAFLKQLMKLYEATFEELHLLSYSIVLTYVAPI